MAIATGCLLTAACAVAPPGIGDPPSYVRVPTSTLVSRRDLQFKMGQVQRGASRSTVLVHQPPGGESVPVAAISSSRVGDEDHVSLQRFPLPAAQGDAADLDLATWEHLYALAIGLDPEARFCLARGTRPCDPAREGHSHTELLRELARARQTSAARAQHRSVPWRVVSMAPAATDGGDADQVAVKVTSEAGPLAGASIFFNRAPHSSCVATIRENGLATCRLVDQHGDEEAHSDHDSAPVLATFPGDVGVDRVLPPTTLLVQRR
jgi:hypothetical protein